MIRLAEPRRPARSSVSSITFCITSIHVCRCCLSTCAASAACDHVSGELGHHFFDRAVRVCEGLDLSRGERVARRGYIWAVFVKRVTFFGQFSGRLPQWNKSARDACTACNEWREMGTTRGSLRERQQRFARVSEGCGSTYLVIAVVGHHQRLSRKRRTWTLI